MVKCALNTQVSSATGESPHYIIFGEDKSLPNELLNAEPQPIYSYDNYVATKIHKFQQIYRRVRDHMKTYSESLKTQKHKKAKTFNVDIGDLVMTKIHVPLAGSSKLSPKFTGPYKIIDKDTGNKYKFQDLETYEVSIRHADDLKITSMKLNLTHETHDEDEPAQADATYTDSVTENEDIIDDNNDMHEYRKNL